MNLNILQNSLAISSQSQFVIHERDDGAWQVILPIQHEDGDILDIYLENSPRGEKYIRISDFGLSLMRLSYSYDINTDNKKRIFDNIIYNHDVMNDSGALQLDTTIDSLYEGVLKFASCLQKIFSMPYWETRSSVNTFKRDISEFIFSDLEKYSPKRNISPLSEHSFNSNINYLNSVDWSLRCHESLFYIFAVQNNEKANRVAVILLELINVSFTFNSFVILKSKDSLGNPERECLERNSSKQYSAFDEFKLNADRDINELASV